MFLPIRTNRRNENTPWVNVALIVVNVVVFAITRDQTRTEAVFDYMLFPMAPKWYQFISYQFLHGTLMHLAGNMLFLWVFGNGIEDRLGKIGYLAFYLAGGVIAGVGHCIFEGQQPIPVLGASGAVSAVTGAFLALFPKTEITIGYFWVVIFGTFEVDAIWLILLQVVQDIFYQFTGQSNVAYLAHLSGYAFGFIVGMGLLRIRLLPREPYDLLAMIEQYRRRQRFREMTKQGYQPWEHAKPGDPPRATPEVQRPPSAQESQIMDLRSRINADITSHQLARAAELYAELLDLDRGQVMGRQQQLDLANQLVASGQYEVAARAYELFLNTYRGDAQRDEVELMLAIMYTRYLDRKQRARELLTAAMPRLHDPRQKALAEQTLAEIG